MESKMLYIEITYSENDFEIDTNIKDELVSDVLCEYIHSIVGDGHVDNREAIERDVYTIRITLDLTYDTFEVTADTGNDGLTTGIIMDVIKRLPPTP